MYVVINITSTALDLCIVVMLAILHSGCWCRIWSSPWRRQFVLKNFHRVTTERLLSKNSWSRRLKFVISPKSVAMSIFNPVAGLKNRVCLLDCSLVGPIVGLKIEQAGQVTEKAQVWWMRLWQTCQGDWGYDPGMVSCRPSSRETITKKHTKMDTWNRLYTSVYIQTQSKRINLWHFAAALMCGRLGWRVLLCPDALVFWGIWICDQVWMWSKWKILGPREISRSQWMASWSIQRSTKDWVENNSFMGSGFSLNSDRFSGNRLRLRITLPDVEMILPNLGAESQWLSAKKELFLPKDKDSWRQRPRIGRTKLGELFFFWVSKDVLNFSLLQEGGGQLGWFSAPMKW